MFTSTARAYCVLASGLPVALVSAVLANAAENIERMAGCFSVTYRFAEDGMRDLFAPDYGLRDPVKELIELDGDGGEITLAHYSVASDGRRVPHFHEVWTKQDGGGGWRQEVFSGLPPSGSSRERRRYSCTAPWQMNRWHCHAGEATKPFRDDGAPFGFARSDYSQLDRENILLVTPSGWVHSQHNRKLDAAGDLVSYELGWITYRRLDPAECDARDEAGE